MSWRNVVSQTEASCWNTSHSDNTSETHTEQVITPFLSKLYDLLAESSNSSFVHWIHSGDCFEVFRPTEFAHQVLPNYYKHNNFSSFIRQLNQYGFRKIDKERWLFQHPCFKRGRKDLLSRIGRRKSNQKQKLANNMIERTTMSGSEEDIKSGTTTDILGDYSESPTQWKSSAKHIDSPVTKSGKDRWEWLCRELVSSKERQRRLSYIIQLDEQKVESLERQLWWMKKCMSDYVEQYSHSHSNLDTNNTTSLNKETGLSTKDTHMDETYLPALDG
ncbi:Heat stress transcription factor B-2b [Galdieria sulphuraria]|nr:Heat stress transcription factor B-2b [Galdieria sulphuraria]